MNSDEESVSSQESSTLSTSTIATIATTIKPEPTTPTTTRIYSTTTVSHAENNTRSLLHLSSKSAQERFLDGRNSDTFYANGNILFCKVCEKPVDTLLIPTRHFK